MQQEVFTPLEEGANIDTAEGFRIVSAEEAAGVNGKMEQFLTENKTAIRRTRERVELKRATRTIEK